MFWRACLVHTVSGSETAKCDVLDVALLAGGEQRCVVVALEVLRDRGVVKITQNGIVRLLEDPPITSSDIELSICMAVLESRSNGANCNALIRFSAPVLHRRRHALVERGLLAPRPSMQLIVFLASLLAAGVLIPCSFLTMLHVHSLFLAFLPAVIAASVTITVIVEMRHHATEAGAAMLRDLWMQVSGETRVKLPGQRPDSSELKYFRMALKGRL